MLTANDPAFGATGPRLAEAVECLERATHWMLGEIDQRPQRCSRAPRPICGCLRMPLAAACWPSEALAAARSGSDGDDAASRIALARFFANHVAVTAPALERTVVEGAASVIEADAALA